MTRPTEHDSALEAELAAFLPAAPSADLRRRVAAALDSASGSGGPGRVRWLGERLVWALGGAASAVAASLAFAPSDVPSESAPIAATAPQAIASPAGGAETESPDGVAEESVAWADAGVQFLDDRTPARILRRMAIERHRSAGGGEYRVPREDVILVPVALR